MIGKGIRRGICHAVSRNGKPNNKNMENYNQNKALSYLTCSNKSNLYG